MSIVFKYKSYEGALENKSKIIQNYCINSVYTSQSE